MAWNPPSPKQLQDLLQGFEVMELIGRGGMGAVYRVRQISLDRMVAIKLLPPALWDAEEDYSERFRHEARMMARLMHPGIITVFDFGETLDGQLYFVMEYIKGIDVAQMLVQQGKLQPLHALSIAAHVCDTLHYAHKHGIIHQDIKPANVMVDMEGKVKVADFGLAKLNVYDSSQSESTATMGTPNYVAPEALVIGMNVDHRADLYSLGVMLYEMLTGKVPHIQLVPPSAEVPGLDRRFDAVVKHALMVDPDVRYQSAALFRKDLDQILSVPVATPVKAKTGPQRPGLSRPTQRRRGSIAPTQHATRTRITPQKKETPWALILLVFIGIAATAFYLLQGNTGPQKQPDNIEVPTPPSGSREPNQSKKQPLNFDKPKKKETTRDNPSSPSSGQEPDQSNTSKSETTTSPRLRKLCEKFAADMEREVKKPHQEALMALDFKYATALYLEVEKVKDTTDKEEILKLNIERSRANSHALVPPKNNEKHVPEGLQKLRDIYWAEHAKLDTVRNRDAEALCNKQGQALSALHDEFVKAGRNNEAAEVDARLKEVKQMHYESRGDF